ncbi:MAG: hypothetical protein ABW321_36130, partial [Polyangiales bacterium]
IDTRTPLACGVITRGPDMPHVSLPPDGQPPGREARAALAGVCFARQFPNTGPACPDAAALTRCVGVHCELGRCAQLCEAHTRCLDASENVCTLGACEPTAECSACQSELLSCALGFCTEHMNCAPPLTPDGPCMRMTSCCALQGSMADPCLAVLTPLLTSLGGDQNCVGSMYDWDVLIHMHVPCTFGDPAPSTVALEPTLPPNSEPSLEDGRVGVMCSGDSECPGGRCAAAPAAEGGAGYCTRACSASAECGNGGQCVALGEHGGEKRCLASCQTQSQCRDGFSCAGGTQGSRLNLLSSCRPKRQVGQLADDQAGRACTSDAACEGGRCETTNLLGGPYPGGYCSGRCYEDAQCGSGGVCLWPRGSTDPGACLQACAADGDCTRPGYGCWELGDGERVLHACYPRADSLPDHTVGRACHDDSACADRPGACRRELPFGGLVTDAVTPARGGYCTQPCALDRECGAGAQCVQHGTLGGLCFASCSAAAPCRAGYACYAHLRDGDPDAKICVANDPDLAESDAGP